MATVLIVDDSDSHREVVRAALLEEGSYEQILEATNGINGLQQLMNGGVDIVVCDLEMPGFDGEKLLQIKQSQPSTSEIPVLFATATSNIDRRMRLLEGGAQDVLTKPFHPRELIARMRLHLSVRQLQEKLIQQNEELERLSTTDELTGMWNRRYIDDVLDIEVERARRYKSPLSVVMIDLDYFKRVNDEYGHAAGDLVLSEAGRRIRDLTRGTDVSARYGGEEFLSVLSQNDAQSALKAAESWRTRIADQPFEIPDGRQIAVTASIGVATYDRKNKSATALVAAADAALYRAKDRGRDCVVHANSSH